MRFPRSPPQTLLLGIGLACLAVLANAADKGVSAVFPDAEARALPYDASVALLIGVGDYTHGWPDLDSVPGEIDQVERMLRAQGFRTTRVVDPDSEALEDAFEGFVDRYGYRKNHRLLFFFSGHGHTRKAEGKGYLVPADAPNPRVDPEGFLRKALGMNKILGWARQIEANHALFVFDSCFSGTVFKARSVPELPEHLTHLVGKPVRQFITAGDVDESVPARSVFTPLFVDGVGAGSADLDKDGFVTGTELGLFLQAQVPKHSRQTPQVGKIRDYELSRGEFVFGMAGGKAGGWEGAGGGAGPLDTGAKSFTGGKGWLYVEVDPEDARIRIMNIRPPYRRGIALAPGSYRIRVDKPGFKPSERWVRVMGKDRKEVRFVLEEEGPRPPLPGMQFVKIAGGCFRMGSPASEQGRDGDETRTEVCVKDFAVATTEATNRQYRAYRPFHQSKAYQGHRLDGDLQPVVHVSWADAVAFANWLGETTGDRYRLPTEAEWEYAARAGSDHPYYWGRTIDPAYVNLSDKRDPSGPNRKDLDDGHGVAAPVASYRPNRFGLHDTAGNVWEWTCSEYRREYDGQQSRCDDADGVPKAIRGGSWTNDPRNQRSAARSMMSPGSRAKDVGFRLVRELPARSDLARR